VTAVSAYNATGAVIRYSSRVLLRFNPQAGSSGIWQISSQSTTPPDIQEDCVDRVVQLSKDNWRRRAPNIVTLRRNSSLRLSYRIPPIDNDTCCEAIIDIAAGPKNTIFQSRKPKDPPRWATDPEVSGSMTLGQWLKFKPKDSLAGRETWLGPPVFGGLKMRLPSGTPRTGKFLVADAVRGTCVSTRWFGPGLNAVISFQYAYPNSAGCSGDGVARCVTLQWQNGILINASPGQFTPPQVQTLVDCSDDPKPDHDPCRPPPPPPPPPPPDNWVGPGPPPGHGIPNEPGKNQVDPDGDPWGNAPGNPDLAIIPLDPDAPPPTSTAHLARQLDENPPTEPPVFE